MSFPALALTYIVDRRRLGFTPTPNQSSHFTLLALRLAPFYIWLGILTMQPHKEERFMFPVYPLLCFNAAVATYLIRGWMEVAYIKFTRSPYQVRNDIIYSQLDHVTKTCFRLLKPQSLVTSPSPLSLPPPSSPSPEFLLYGIIITLR